MSDHTCDPKPEDSGPDTRCLTCNQEFGPGYVAFHPLQRPEFLETRPSWDDIWMTIAEQLSLRSTCSRLSVGCVVVSADNTAVLGLGYNGGPKGVSNECLSREPGNCGHLHAEINALIKTNYRDASPKKVYITTEPCYGCAVALVNAGVQEVIYLHEYRDHTGLELLGQAKVPVRRLA
jgi:dCMP deaminase